jgi:hypothetical protein
MKVLMLAVMPWVASAGDCTLQSVLGKSETTCTIPSSTTISDECCSSVQGLIDKALANPKTFQPSQADMQGLQMQCMSVAMYVMQHMPQGPPSSNPAEGIERAKMMIEALPDGLTCTEKITGAGEPVCDLHAGFSKLKLSCEMPKETAITPECCSAMQETIDDSMGYLAAGKTPPPEALNKYMSSVQPKCQSFIMYGMQNAAKVQQIERQNIDPVEKYKMIIDSDPAGSSCTQTIYGGDAMSLYENHPIFSKIALAVGVGGYVSDQASAVPLGALGIAGVFAGGLIVAGALFRYSKKQQDNQYSFLAAQAA